MLTWLSDAADTPILILWPIKATDIDIIDICTHRYRYYEGVHFDIDIIDIMTCAVHVCAHVHAMTSRG